PVVPLARRQALGIAVMSYDGHLGFGLLGDFDALPELEAIAGDMKWAISSLTGAAGVAPKPKRRVGKRASAASGKSAASRNGARASSARKSAAR
ncbi:MAG TPA: WS/DGAT domain-containing protein, partial [Solirubrobacteraceae bacterium]